MDKQTLDMRYKHQMGNMIEQVIRFKYRDIKSLVVIANEDETLSIQFEDDGIHTKEMIENYIVEVKKECSYAK